MKRTITKRRIMLMLIDLLIVIDVYGVIVLCAGLKAGTWHLGDRFALVKLIGLAICLLLPRLALGIYNSIWRYANVRTHLKLILSDTIGGALFILLGRLYHGIYLGVAYSVTAVLFIMLATLTSRFVYQLIYAVSDSSSDLREGSATSGQTKGINRINVAIVGAGNVGATLAGELTRNPKAHYRPYCFIDKDVAKIGSEINGIRVYPENERVIEFIQSHPIQEIIIALPDASAEDKRRLYDLYQRTGCKVKIYDYPLGDSDAVNKRSLREFKIEDLLFRDSIAVKSAIVRPFYADKVVLVTGGGGSIGSELCRQIAKMQPKKLVILDIYENNAYDIQQELVRYHGDRLSLEVVIASVRDVQRLDEIFREVRPDIVFHAAAHKHVPLMEHSGCEAIKNNVIGTYNVADMAEKYGVHKMVLISTDKAVNPTNIMGASKRLCEMVIQCRTDAKTEFAAVRFGNVLGSNGSVIPLFKKQIAAGGPITLTDKRIIRYFMTIPEAVGLVMETGAIARNGELFVLDMGKPVRILDLAENMIRLSGLKPYEDIDIVEIGLRPGEKLYEELLMQTEDLDKTENELIFIERDRPLSRAEVDAKIEVLMHAIEDTADSRNGFHDAVIAALKVVVPTFREPHEVNQRAAVAKEMNDVKQVALGANAR
ncbi:MAG: nucleoside-diphosphate sugar epimerase/dehydratase [Eubacteriales bacterium]|nr:nucleoside-diphosphate sugar epimerase/dehydratase [Eubacteriales bacterium]